MLYSDLVFLILQFLGQEKYNETVLKLEQESGLYFNLKHFEDKVLAGEWDAAEKYLGGFTKLGDNAYSTRIFFEIRKHKYLEALDRNDSAEAVEILRKDLNVFGLFDDKLLTDITKLLNLENFRQHVELSEYVDAKSERSKLMFVLEKLIRANPSLRDNLTFPKFEASRLQTLIERSLSWQCKNPNPNTDIGTLITDCTCAPTNGARPPPPTNGPIIRPVPKPGPFFRHGARSAFRPFGSPSPSVIAGWQTNSNTLIPHAAVAQVPPSVVQPLNTVAILKHPSTSVSATDMDHQTADSVHLMMRTGPSQPDDVLFSGTTHPAKIYSQDDLSKTVVCTVNQGSNVMSRSLEGSQGASQQIYFKGPNINALGSVFNVSNPIAATLERPGRIQTAVPRSSLAGTGNKKEIDIRPGIADDSDKPNSWKLTDIVDTANLKALQLPESMPATNKVVQLLYTNSGTTVLALASNAIHKLWKLQRTERNPQGKSTASFVPQLWQPANDILMINDTSGSNPEESNACIALSKNESYVLSASGGKVSLFNTMNFKVMLTIMRPPPAATFLAFHPQDNNIIAVGMEDSSIQIYDFRFDEVKTKLKGHEGKITGLAFSESLNVLVSSGADAQLCVWSTDEWEKVKSKHVERGYGCVAPLVGETRVQFHNNQKNILVARESLISIYDSRLECLRKWSPGNSVCTLISSAIYSCDGMLVYAGFCDGAVGVFDADSLVLRCRIAPSAYISPFPSSAEAAYPTAIAAHPSERNQIALGMSDGAVHVLEPSDAEM